MADLDQLRSIIRTVPDFPKPGINFYDLTTLWKDGASHRALIDHFADRYKGRGVTKVLGIEARGFILGAPLAYVLGAGFVPARKPNKLPSATMKAAYSLEYGTDSIEIHLDAVGSEDRVVMIDDLIATGGTAVAALSLLRSTNAEVLEAAFLVDLSFLAGRSRLDCPTYAALEYKE